MEPARAIRKLAAVLALDVCGYSRMMEMDEEGTLARLKGHRHEALDPAIAHHRGRIVKTTGDGLLAEFASAVEAVRCALQIQRSMRDRNASVPEGHRMELRIGINVGDVIADDGDLFGDGVNIAARLEGLALPGGICMSDRVREDVRGKIDLLLEDAGLQSLKNIERQVHVYRVIVDRVRGTRPPAIHIDMSLPDKPSIAVMPFANMSGDGREDAFTDGITEDVITELSRFRSLFVIAKNSTFTYKGRSPDPKRVGTELGVRYLVEGSIRRSGNNVRVSAQLIDALTGNHLWAERYDRVLEDIFAVQEELTRSIIAQVAPQIDQAEQSRAVRKRPGNLTAYEIAVRSWTLWQQAWFKHDSGIRNDAMQLAREALAIDPCSVRALNALAMCQWQHLFYSTAPDMDAARREGIDAVERALEIDRSDHWGHMLKGLLMALSGGSPRWDEALHSARYAHQLNPNDSLALHALGWIETLAGEAAAGMQHMGQVLRANPRDPWLSNVHIVLALASFVLRDYEAGIHWAQLASSLPVSHHNIAVCYVGLGDLEKARLEVDKARALAPELLEARLMGQSLWRREEDRKRHTIFLRIAAGLEAPAAAEGLR